MTTQTTIDREYLIGRVAGGVDATTVPDYCELDCDRRILPGERLEEVFADIQRLLDEIRRGHRTLPKRKRLNGRRAGLSSLRKPARILSHRAQRALF